MIKEWRASWSLFWVPGCHPTGSPLSLLWPESSMSVFLLCLIQPLEIGDIIKGLGVKYYLWKWKLQHEFLSYFSFMDPLDDLLYEKRYHYLLI